MEHKAKQYIPVEIKIADKAFADKHDLFKRGSDFAAGIDLRANIPETIRLAPGEQVLVGVGFAAFVNNPNFMLALYPRSGIGVKGLVLGNLTGIIDPDYQDELKVCLWNRKPQIRIDNAIQAVTMMTESNDIIINPGDRIAQMVLQPILHADFKIVDEFSEISGRGTDGFGASGVK